MFLTLEATEVILFIGIFANGNIVKFRLHRRPDRAGRLVHLGGRGANGMGGPVVPVGRPILGPRI